MTKKTQDSPTGGGLDIYSELLQRQTMVRTLDVVLGKIGAMVSELEGQRKLAREQAARLKKELDAYYSDDTRKHN